VRSLAEALVAAVNDPAERRRRGDRAAPDMQRRFTSLPIAERVAGIYDRVLQST
jgi:hypothetical protein